ncbi:DNA-binding CsgD family transcriptional regulator [Thermocatellispora tengchongensis]|uniref:DNA-binding CsgD family transcriptional regulator n=1 Tax=Thermocatellispora tengchongensis TaxID=1073253 RepID=A0A840P7R0_9ACTN|nr:helix-turn-helix transcriptional regulator [Thermocatellispora tengchongensis]MBB5134636.1 DNA-binding CsgD family transcriptional regulator [Thermocatellispora tengchongensis]
MIDGRTGTPRQAGHAAWPPVGLAPHCCPACGSRDASAGAIARRAALPQPIATALLLAPSLTGREHAAFELLGLGYDNRSIARMLSISERTAKRHVTAILTKLRLESRLQAGLTAMLMNLATQAEPSARTQRADARASHDEII